MDRLMKSFLSEYDNLDRLLTISTITCPLMIPVQHVSQCGKFWGPTALFHSFQPNSLVQEHLFMKRHHKSRAKQDIPNCHHVENTNLVGFISSKGYVRQRIMTDFLICQYPEEQGRRGFVQAFRSICHKPSNMWNHLEKTRSAKNGWKRI